MTLPIKANRQSHEDKPPAGREDSVNEFSFDDDASSFDIRDKDISPTPDRLPTEPEYAHRLESEPVPAGRNPFPRPLQRPIVHPNPLATDKPPKANPEY